MNWFQTIAVAALYLTVFVIRYIFGPLINSLTDSKRTLEVGMKKYKYVI